MRNLGYALVAAVIMLMPLSAKADQITEMLSITVFPAMTIPNSGNFAGTAFPKFNPSIGTLNNIMTTLTGPATWTSSIPSQFFVTCVALHGTGECVTSFQDFPSPGTININLSGTDSFAPDLATLTGTGTTTLDLRAVIFDLGDTFATSASGLSGSITFNYTPSATIPEPSSLALFGIGFVGLAFFRYRKSFQYVVGRGSTRGSIEAA